MLMTQTAEHTSLDINMLINSISTFAAIAAAFAAWWGIREENRRAKRASSVDLLLRFENEFNRPETQRLRRETAKGWLAGSLADEATGLYDFFDTLGMLVRREAIDEEFVWHSFYGIIDNYCSLIRPILQEFHKTSPEVWKDVVFLHDRMKDVESRRNREYTPPSPEALKSYLAKEAQLGEGPEASYLGELVESLISERAVTRPRTNVR